ncbi:MAG: PIN domain-containing protein [Thermoguttaceae bacterium]|jgi:predicted nucleic acid-binding protein
MSEAEKVSRIFLDTNILVYVFDLRDPQKQAKAHDLVRSIIHRRTGVVSTQVLQEFASVALTKLHHTAETVIRELIILESLEVVQVTPKLVRQGVEILKQYKIHFWDAILLAAAEEAQCDQLYSEDFPNGAVYNKVRVVNPLV